MIEDLEVGEFKIIESINIEDEINSSIYDYRVKHLRGREYLVERYVKKTKRSSIIDLCENMHPFGVKEVDCSYNYAVSVVSEYGDPLIKAVKKNGKVFIIKKYDFLEDHNHEYNVRSMIGFKELFGEYENIEPDDENDSDDENEYKDEPQDFEYDEEPLM